MLKKTVFFDGKFVSKHMDELLRKGIETMNEVLRIFTVQDHTYLAIGSRIYNLDHLILVGTNHTQLIRHFVGGRYEAIVLNKSKSTTAKFTSYFREWLEKYPNVRPKHVDVL